MSEKPTLIVGDVQGHMRRLEALLLQEGILGACEVCGGSGDVSEADSVPADFCPACKGSGTARLRHDVRILQVGDLIDARWDTQTADSLAIHFADQWVDEFLWGNHDRPVIDPNPYLTFGGYATPLPEVVHRMKLQMHQGRWNLAREAHGFLITHAGVPAYVGEALRIRPEEPGFASLLNGLDRHVLDRTVHKIRDSYYDGDQTPEIAAFVQLRDAIGPYRGGRHREGGLLWRDAMESLYPVRQIFGHSSDEHVQEFETEAGKSYGLDLSKHGKLGAIWLPEERIIELDCTSGDLLPESPAPAVPEEPPIPDPA